MFLSFCILDEFFQFSKKSGFGVFLIHPTMVSVLLFASVERCFVSCMQDFFKSPFIMSNTKDIIVLVCGDKRALHSLLHGRMKLDLRNTI